MYINPFERMKKQKEDEAKRLREKEKEKEKYIRLGAQMGFVEDKAVIPSFIKTMMDDTQKVSVPPFINADQTYNNNNNNNFNSNHTSISSKIGFSDNNQPNLSESYLYQNINSMNSNPQQNISLPPLTNQQMPGGNNNYIPQTNNLNQVQRNNFDNNNFNLGSLNNTIPQNNMNGFNPPIMDNMISNSLNNNAFANQHQSNFETPIIQNYSNQEFNSVSNKKSNEVKEFKNIKPFYKNEDSELTNDLLDDPFDRDIIEDGYTSLTLSQFKDLFDKPDLENKVIMIPVDKQDNKKITKYIKNNLINNYNVFIDISEISKYKRPYRFFLKQIVSKLPIKMEVEDRIELWERVDLMFKATSWGKSSNFEEIEEMLDEVFIVKDPIDMICEEFSNLFESYDFDRIITIFVENFIPIDPSLKKGFIEFFNKIVVKIPQINLTFISETEFYNKYANEYIFDYVDILIKMKKKNNGDEVTKENVKKDNEIDRSGFSLNDIIQGNFERDLIDTNNFSNNKPAHDLNINLNQVENSPLPFVNTTMNHNIGNSHNQNEGFNTHSLRNDSLNNISQFPIGQQNIQPMNRFEDDSEEPSNFNLLNNNKMRIDVSKVLEKRQLEIDVMNKKEELAARKKADGPIFRTEILANNSNKESVENKSFNLWDQHENNKEVAQINIQDTLHMQRKQEQGENMFSIKGSNWDNLNK
ncbi:hypothetical protein SLITO_v1c10600 [Spiroplasma litorale]|uniref:Uncharacterized protein n=1 Tax=Spiroplasma litorale TaxID=216942 RepID=A0A0K1W3A4_9MOLU|nr:hypothetical protein [Spiroplasma litorale]AKX34671.1 hypothetical protein SLITO_v1c10600 [Spiroplasma litorale]